MREASAVYGVLTEGLGLYDFPLGVLKGGPRKEQTAIFGKGVEALGGLADDGSGYLEVYAAFARDYRLMPIKDRLVAVMSRLNPALTSIELDKLRGAEKIILGQKLGETTMPFDLSQESEGFRRVFAHLLALYQDPSKMLNCFEESENGVHPGALQLLAEQFTLAPREDRGQVLLTTHNPALLDHLPVEGLRVVEMVNGETKIGRVSAEQRQAVIDGLLEPGELLYVDEARREEEEEAEATGEAVGGGGA